MIVKSYEVKRNKSFFKKNNLFLLYGENLGLKKDIKNFIIKEIQDKNENIETLSLYENEILENDENFFNLIYSPSLFSKKKIILVYENTDKIIKKIQDVYDKYPEEVFPEKNELIASIFSVCFLLSIFPNTISGSFINKSGRGLG